MFSPPYGIGLHKLVDGEYHFDDETRCTLETSATKEVHERGCGQSLRGILENNGLATTSVNHDTRHTWFGAEGRSSLIDHVCCPLPAPRT